MDEKEYSPEAKKLLDYLTGLILKSPFKHKLQTKVQAKKHPKIFDINFVTDEEFDLVYQDYVNFYNSMKESLKDVEPDYVPIVTEDSYKDDFGWLLNDYVNRNHDKEQIRSYEGFLDLTKNWIKGRNEHTMKEWYNIYLNKIDEQPGNVIEFKGETNLPKIAFRSNMKINKLRKLLDKEPIDNFIVKSNSFPINDNKKFYLHKLREPNTYIIDIMFEDQLGYLIAIECNSRYLYVDCLNRSVFNDPNKRSTKNIRTTNSVISSLKRLINKGMKPYRLTGDDEGAFASKEAIEFYDDNNIIWEPVNRMLDGVYPDFMNQKQTTSPLHSSLGIIDRVIRTLRDMAFNCEVPKIVPTIMEELVEQYNNAPHITLSMYAGNLVSPKDMMLNQNLYNFICRRISQSNYNIKNQPDFNIEPGTEVKVYNNKDVLKKRRTIIQPGRYFVEGFSNGLYIIRSDKNTLQRLPRYRITPLK